MPPEPPELPAEARPSCSSRSIPWAAAFILLVTTVGFFGYLLRYARMGQQAGDGSAPAGFPAWIRSTSSETRAPGQRLLNRRWPSVRVSAIMAPSSSRPGTVTLNGKLYGVGDEIRGIIVVEIEAHRVLLEYHGEQRHLLPGQSTRM